MSQENYDDELDDGDIVIVKSEGVLGIILQYGAYVSTVLYCVDGLMFEEIMENEDFEPVEVD